MSELNHHSEVNDLNKRNEFHEHDKELGQVSELLSVENSNVVENLNKGMQDIDDLDGKKQIQASTPLKSTVATNSTTAVHFEGRCRNKCLKCGVETITWQ